VQEGLIPGLLSSYLLERYEQERIEVQLRCNRTKTYLRRWFLSRVLTNGNIGDHERIMATIVFNGDYGLERLFNLIITKIIRRKTDLVLETYELCRNLYPYMFPRLPDVKDSNSEPYFLISLSPIQRRKTNRSNRVRNPSAVGGKHGRGVIPLPMISSGGQGPSNVDEIFLETYILLSS
jgi:hypothetical protein